MLHKTFAVGVLPSAMNHEEAGLFQALGRRIAAARKAADLTQVQLAEALDASQRIIASYEIGRRRVPVSLLPMLARALSVTIEELVGEEDPQQGAGKRGLVSRVQQQLEQIRARPGARQKFLSELIEAAL
jgi:transcriptional regulator with XRE-family HTH domain